jgi:hypothetical protein
MLRKIKPVSQLCTIESAHTYHALYVAVRAAHSEAPQIWTDGHCTRILTSIMSGKPFSWRVVGITEAALRRFHELNYRYQSRLGLTRAHLRERIETVRELLSRSEPMSASEFIEYWLANDRTILCAVGQNKAIVPPYIEIENNDGSLFSSNLVGWRHGKDERDLLRSLYEKYSPTWEAHPYSVPPV